MKTKGEQELPEDVLLEDTAIEYAQAWQANHPIKGFVVPLNDFKRITEEVGAASARIYMGFNGTEEKLMMVGVDSEGNDMINYEEGLYIYDFTTPCPAMCDENSPLYITE